MRVLLTGGTGVVGPATVSELVGRGHTIRLLSRHAVEESRQWPSGVAALDGSVTEPESIRGAAEGCAAVIHMAAVVTESGDATFERVNVEGTRNVVLEAERAGAARLLYVSSQGADRGGSEYHKSKREGERIALASPVGTIVLRLANVYGPGDEIISLLIKMIRILPVVPAIDGGDDNFQPMWVGDAAKAIPLRGNVQVRVEELTPRSMTLVTLEGHPLVGAVRFLSEERGDCIRFEVQVYERAADVTDWLIMRTVGQMIQTGTWKSIVRNVAKESGGDIVGGVHAGVHTEVESLDEEQAGRISAWLRDLVVERKRDEAVVGGGAG